ncbi:hypothetical protein ACEE62_11180, partial [Corynebacterium sp. 32222D000BW]
MPRLLPASRPAAVRAACLIAVAAACIASVTWPFVLPGELVWRDMVVPADMAFSPANFGGGDLPARAVPQDGLLALAAQLVPAHWLVRALVIGSAVAAAWGGWRLTRLCAPAAGQSPEVVADRHLLGPAAAIALCVANPLVIERLLQGQWSIAAAAWLG